MNKLVNHKTKKTNRMRTCLAALLCGVALTLLPGCAAVLLVGASGAAGAGGYAYIKGQLQSTESASLDRVWNASLAAMKDLGFAVITQPKDALGGNIVARTSADKKININLKKISDNSTEVRIRVGTFGDEAVSRTILDKIKAHL